MISRDPEMEKREPKKKPEHVVLNNSVNVIKLFYTIYFVRLPEKNPVYAS